LGFLFFLTVLLLSKYLAQIEEVVKLILMTTQTITASVVSYAILQVIQRHLTPSTAHTIHHSFNQYTYT